MVIGFTSSLKKMNICSATTKKAQMALSTYREGMLLLAGVNFFL